MLIEQGSIDTKVECDFSAFAVVEKCFEPCVSLSACRGRMLGSIVVEVAAVSRRDIFAVRFKCVCTMQDVCQAFVFFWI